MGKISFSDIMDLNVSERIVLVQDILDSIAADAESIPLTEEECAEIDRRMEAHRRNPSAGSSWEEVKARLLKQL